MGIDKVYIISWHDLENAYACLYYLAEKIANRSDVELWSKTNLKNVPKYRNVKQVSFFDKWYGKIKYFRNIVSQIEIFMKAVYSKNTLFIINDWEFYIPLFWARKINHKIIVIHYNTEIAGRDVKALNFMKSFYKKQPDYADMIIDCLDERAKWRKRKYAITKKIYVINNTIPRDKISIINEHEKDNLINNFSFEKKLPIIIYAGRASMDRQLSKVIDSVERLRNKANFSFFLYGTEAEKKALREYCFEKCTGGNYIINDAIPRNDLLKVMCACDIGINYYEPEYSINYRYASPTKFFEYMACGLNIVSTNNIGINKIIKDNDIGVCIEKNESISDAISRLLKKGLKSHDEIRSIFESQYCYDVDSSETIKRIYDLMT